MPSLVRRGAGDSSSRRLGPDRSMAQVVRMEGTAQLSRGRESCAPAARYLGGC